MKISKKISTIFFSVFMILLIGVIGLSMISRSSNYGVPKIFGYQFLVVKTDSMEPTLKVGTMIFVQDVEMSSFRPEEKDEEGNITYPGDIITFYDKFSRKAVITHRLLTVSVNDKGNYSFTAVGDNKSSCSDEDCTGKIDIFDEDVVLGKVISSSKVVGDIYTFIANPVVMFILLFVPIGYIGITTVFDFKKKNKEERKKENEKV